MNRNKSNWYVRRRITMRDGYSGPTIKSFYDVRKDKEPQEAEVGDTVVMLDDDGYEDALIGVVDHIGLYDDGLYKIAIKTSNYDCFFLTTPNRIGILEKKNKEMKGSKELKMTDLRIGDKVREKSTGFEFIVTGIFWSLYCSPTEATIYADFESDTADPWEFELDEIELVDKGDNI